jgi:hypothetical protein
MGRRLNQLNKYFAKSWRIMAYQPVLYVFIFAASVRLWHNDSPPPKFDYIARNFYDIWLILGIVSPIVALIAWICVQKRTGRAVFIGMWVRLAADIGIMTNLLSYHLATISDGRSEATIFSRYLMGATMFFVLTLIVRDLWAIYIMEKLAGQIDSIRNE